MAGSISCASILALHVVEHCGRFIRHDQLEKQHFGFDAPVSDVFASGGRDVCTGHIVRFRGVPVWRCGLLPWSSGVFWTVLIQSGPFVRDSIP